MKITSNSPASKPVTPSAASRAGASGRPATGSATGSASTDPAAHLSRLEAQLSPSDFSSAKVNEISAAIAAGRYKVNAGAVADGLIASTSQMATKPGSGR